MILADSHCHLAMLGPEKSRAKLDRARGEGVRGFLVPGTRLDDALPAIEVAEAYDGVWAAVGFHPHEAKDCDEAAFARIRDLAGRPEVVAIGEVGLDYHYLHSPREVQREVLVRHLDLAGELDLPAVIHNRESTADLTSILTERRGDRGVLHSFTEGYEVAALLLDRGFYISFSGILTFRSAEQLRETAAKLPMDRVLIETDTPYLAPVPHRGKENEPAFVVRVAETLASLWGTSVERVAEATTENFETLFRVKIPG